MLSMADVLARSSNIGAIEIARVIGAPKLHEYVERFGFGKTTGLTVPSESAGMVRQLKKWGSTTWASVAMGHEVSVTTLQLAQACSIIANGGQLVRPVLVLKRQRPGEPERLEPREKPVQAIKPETAITMRRLMEGVNILPYGTGFRHARLKGYTSGGKTGTAMIYDFANHVYTHKYNASYMGFAPLVNPAVVVVVTLTGTTGGAGYGGVVSGPVFRAVATDALRILDVPKDLPDSLEEPRGADTADMNDLSIAGLDPNPGSELESSIPQGLDEVSKAPVQTPFFGPQLASVIPSAAVVGPKVPNFRGKMMRDVIREAALTGITVELIGHGVARAQAPDPGAVLLPGERVRVQFNR
jgi:membrane peptidoglycan carboxypeptidase